MLLNDQVNYAIYQINLIGKRSFSLEEVGVIITQKFNKITEEISRSQIIEILQGRGDVRPKSICGELWEFGSWKQPQSQEISSNRIG